MNRILSISLFLALGQALGQAEEDGKLVATEYSPFGSVGSMVGIHVDHQNRVHGTHTYRRNTGALAIRRSLHTRDAGKHLFSKELQQGERTKLDLYPGSFDLVEDAILSLKNVSSRVSAIVEAARGKKTNGVIMAQGGRLGGWSR